MRALALAAAVALLVLFGTFRTRSETLPGGTREETSIGLWFSPWFTRSKEETMVRAASGPGSARSMTWQMQVEFLSWSWPVLVAAIVLLRYGCRRPRAAPSP
jgi:hypothetical protein